MYQAVKFQASSEDAKAQGIVLAPYLQILKGSVLESLIEKYDLDKLDMEAFYPQQYVCDMQAEMAEKMGLFSGELVAIGKESVDSIGFAPEVNTVEAALETLHNIYQAIHQNIPEEEGWRYYIDSENNITVTFNAPYEEFAAYGYIWAIVQKFRPEGSEFSVRMTQENELTTYQVTMS